MPELHGAAGDFPMVRSLVAGLLSAVLTLLLIRNEHTVLSVFSSWQVVVAILTFVVSALLAFFCTLQWRAGLLVSMGIVAGVCVAIGLPVVASIPLLFVVPALVSFGIGLGTGDSWTGRPS